MDVQLRQQFPQVAPDVSFGPDAAEQDLWFRENFPVPGPDLSFYPTRWGVDQFITGPQIETFILAAGENPDTAAFAVTVTPGGATVDFALGATESPDVAVFIATLGHPFSLAASEAPDVAAFTLTLPQTGPQTGSDWFKRKRRRRVEARVETRVEAPKAPEAPRPYPHGALWSQYVDESLSKWVRETPPPVVAAVREVAERDFPEVENQSTHLRELSIALKEALWRRQQVEKAEYLEYLRSARQYMEAMKSRRKAALALLLMLGS